MNINSRIRFVFKQVRVTCVPLLVYKYREDTGFYEDIWVGEVPLKLLFPKLYDYCKNKKCSVRECWKEEEWTMQFRRAQTPEDAT